MSDSITTSPERHQGLESAVTLLATARHDYEGAKAELDAKRKKFDEENAVLIEQVSSLKSQMESADLSARIVALDAYAIDNAGKKPHPAIEIKMFDTVNFDTQAALNWARLYMPGLLALDSRAYEKLLKEVHNSKTLAEVIKNMPGDVTEEARATIARDLSPYLPLSANSQETK